jgi:hypothetical protein
METPTPIYAAHCFTSVIEELCRVLTKHGRGRFVSAPLLLLIWNRLIRMARRFASITERYCAAKVSGTPSDTTGPARSRGASVRPARVKPVETLPGHFRWLVNMVPETEAMSGDLCWLLQRPETQELISEAPQVGRILRPLCRMLGVEPTSALRRPMRARVPLPQETSEPPPTAPKPVNDDCSPQSHEPEQPREFSAEYWKLHPPPWLPKLE